MTGNRGENREIESRAVALHWLGLGRGSTAWKYSAVAMRDWAP